LDGKLKWRWGKILRNIINIEIKHYTYTAGAHGYQGYVPYYLAPTQEKTILQHQLFKDRNTFRLSWKEIQKQI
jgi:hypothetical protein